MKILVADDHPVVRNGIKEIVQDISASYEIEEAEDAQEVVAKVVDCDYDLIILDISMPGGGGINALKQIKQNRKNAKVLMLSIYEEEQYVRRSLQAGALGYLTKALASDELGLAIKKILSGSKYLSSEIASKMSSKENSDQHKPKHERLSKREYQVYKLIVNGYRISEIAEELHLSSKTISTYRIKIMEKMDMAKNTELVQYALTNNLMY